MSGVFRSPLSDDSGDVYTSLLSSQCLSSGRESSYLSDDLKPSKPSSGSSLLDDFPGDSYGFSSSKVTSSLADNLAKSSFGSDKTESYNYMDISHGDECREQPQGGARHSVVDTASSGFDLLGSYIDKTPGRVEENEEEEEEEEEENLGPALGSHSFPYVEEPSDEELSDYRSYRNLGGTPQTASPVKITLTESQALPAPILVPKGPAQPTAPVSVSDRDNILSVGQQGVPTVTLSEPEDDSPASTPNASPTRRQQHTEPACYIKGEGLH